MSPPMERGVSTFEVTLDETTVGERFDRALALALPELSRARIQALLSDGHVTIGATQAIPRASARVSAPMRLQVTLPPASPATAAPQPLALVIVHEDEHVIVVDKPAGMVVHPAAGNLDGTLVNALLHHCAGQLSGIGGVERPGIVHRIDKDTSGLIVAAKTDRAHEGLSRQFADHSIERAYRAIVAGRPMPTSGTVNAPLGRSERDRKKMAVVGAGRGKRAVTHFTSLETLRDATLIECRLETGRTHQVRVHMAHIGHPLLGDPAYGRPRAAHGAILRSLSFERQALHAIRLGFIHPVSGNSLAFMSELPDDMQELLSRLRV